MFSFVLLFLVLVHLGQCDMIDLSALVQVPCLNDALNQILTEPNDTLIVAPAYDYIIVGAGSAGCILANKLTENPNIQVLLIEAGGPELFLYDVPLNAPFLQTSLTSYRYYSTPNNISCLGGPNQQCLLPRGKVMGGSSAINFMFYSRGNAADYNHWEQLGASGWNYESVLPYFKKIEKFNIPDLYIPSQNGDDGPITIEYASFETDIAKQVGAAIVNNGFNRYGNVNNASNVAASRLPSNTENGIRESTSRAYLHPIYKRPNLHVKKFSTVTKIIIDPNNKTATGVEFLTNIIITRVKARKEVILSAGSINSPQLLMLSGVGPADQLAKFNIPVIVNNSNVGKNLQDHYGYVLHFTNNCSKLMSPDAITEYCFNHTGQLTIPGGAEFLSLQAPDSEGIPQYEIIMDSDIDAPNVWTAFPFILKPRSIGSITLKTGSPFDYPYVNTNYLSNQTDIDVLVQAGLSVLAINSMPELQQCNSTLMPNVNCPQYELGSVEYLKCVARYNTQTVYHQSCTCRMGSVDDGVSVVDERMRVIGVKNLRVIDGSVMTEIPSAHTNAPVMMLALRGAEFVIADCNTC